MEKSIHWIQPDGVVEAMVAANGRIVALGAQDEMKALAPSDAQVIDLEGAVAFPGFYDSHNHLVLYSYLLSSLDMTPAKVDSVQDIVDLVGRAAADAPAGEWIKGFGFIDYALSDHRYPTRRDLDPVSGQHPVVLYHTSFHACVLNSKALEFFGLDATSQPLEWRRDRAGGRRLPQRGAARRQHDGRAERAV